MHRDAAGTPDGYVRYHQKEDKWEAHQPQNVLQIDELMALDDAAHADLWRFCAEMDWVAKVVAERRSPAERLPWMLANGRAAHVSDIGDDLWVRLFDVPRALEARTYEAEGSLVIEVVDAELDGGPRPGRASTPGPMARPVASTDRTPDLTVDVVRARRGLSGRDAAPRRGHRLGLRRASSRARSRRPSGCSARSMNRGAPRSSS